MPSPLGDLQRETGALVAAGTWGRAAVSADTIDSFVVICISGLVLFVGLLAPVVQHDYPLSPAARTAASVSVTLNVVILAIIPRGPASGTPYSDFRVVASEAFRAAALLLGLIGSATPLDSEDGIARWSSAFATFCSFIYSRLDDKRKHHWTRPRENANSEGAPLLHRLCCYICGGATQLLWCAVVFGVLAVLVQPGLVVSNGTLWPLLAYVIGVPVLTVLFDIFRDKEMPRCYRIPALIFCVVLILVTVGLVCGIPRDLYKSESEKLLIEQEVTFGLCWTSAAGVPVLSAFLLLLAPCFSQRDGVAAADTAGNGNPHAAGEATPDLQAPPVPMEPAYRELSAGPSPEHDGR